MTAIQHPHKRILLVEDDWLVGGVIADLLNEAGFEVDGPHHNVSDGEEALARHFPDGAVLDVRLKGRNVFLLADDLEQYGIPFVLCSGARPDTSYGRFLRSPFLRKDQLNDVLIRVLEHIIQ